MNSISNFSEAEEQEHTTPPLQIGFRDETNRPGDPDQEKTLFVSVKSGNIPIPDESNESVDADGSRDLNRDPHS